MQNPTKQRYFDPQDLLAEDTVRRPLHCMRARRCCARPHAAARSVLAAVASPSCCTHRTPTTPLPCTHASHSRRQMIPTTFHYAVKSLGKALDPTCTSTDVRRAPCQLGILKAAQRCLHEGALRVQPQTACD